MTVLELPPATDSVPVARRFLRERLSESELDVDTAVLLTSEVVTNAILHARTPVTVTIHAVPGLVRIAVRDLSPVQPRIHSFSANAATGRGLRLLDQLARRWGVDAAQPVGKIVWFEVGPPAEGAWGSFGEQDWLVDEADDD